MNEMDQNSPSLLLRDSLRQTMPLLVTLNPPKMFIRKIRNLALISGIILSTNFLYAQIENSGSNIYKHLRRESDQLSLRQDSIAYLAMNRVFDTSFSEDERIDLVLLIAEIGTDTCIKFLLKNISKRMYTGPINGDREMVKVNIFYSALAHNVSNNGGIIKCVLSRINEEIDEKDFYAFAMIFASACTDNRAARLILERHFLGTQEPLRYNLNKMLSIIPIE